MRRLLLLTLVTCLCAAAYIASPFVSAWYIRSAIHSGDAAYLSDKIEWASLKETLKPSLSRMALDLPLDPSAGDPKPSLWKRIKAKFGRGIVERTVDGYVTPEGITQLFSLRKGYRDHIAKTPDDESKKPLTERVKAFWARVHRAEFTELTRFELDVVDKTEPNRLYAGVLQLRGFDWKLTELRIRDAAKAGATMTPQAPEAADQDADPAAWETAATTSRGPLAAATPAEGSPLER